MTTPGAQALMDVHTCALKVVAAFKDDPIREQLHPVQVQCLDDLYAACRMAFELATPRRSE